MKRIPQYNNATVEKAHDVRTLRVCAHCEGIGNADSMIRDNGKPWHGRCYVAVHGEEMFFALPTAETNKVTLEDIGPDLMMLLVNGRPGRWRQR